MRLFLDRDDWLPVLGMLFDSGDGRPTNLSGSCHKVLNDRSNYNPTELIAREIGLEIDIINLWIGLEQG